MAAVIISVAAASRPMPSWKVVATTGCVRDTAMTTPAAPVVVMLVGSSATSEVSPSAGPTYACRLVRSVATAPDPLMPIAPIPTWSIETSVRPVAVAVTLSDAAFRSTRSSTYALASVSLVATAAMPVSWTAPPETPRTSVRVVWFTVVATLTAPPASIVAFFSIALVTSGATSKTPTDAPSATAPATTPKTLTGPLMVETVLSETAPVTLTLELSPIEASMTGVTSTTATAALRATAPAWTVTAVTGAVMVESAVTVMPPTVMPATWPTSMVSVVALVEPATSTTTMPAPTATAPPATAIVSAWTWRSACALTRTVPPARSIAAPLSMCANCSLFSFTTTTCAPTATKPPPPWMPIPCRSSSKLASTVTPSPAPVPAWITASWPIDASVLLETLTTSTEAPTATKPPWTLPTRPKKSSRSLATTPTAPPARISAPSWIAATVPSGIEVSLTAFDAMPVWAVKEDFAVALFCAIFWLAGSVSLLPSESMIFVQPLVPAVPDADRSASACALSGTSCHTVALTVGSLPALETFAVLAWYRLPSEPMT